jgi:vancomycin resistance protein YoaR
VARSTRGDDWPARESEGGRVVLAVILGLALLAGGAYAGMYAAAGDKVPVGTKIAGIDIGGHNPTSAEQVLRDGLAGRADTPFTVVINGRRQQVRPSQVGLGVDYAASVSKAGARRSWRPSRLWSYFTDGATYQPVVTLDQRRLAALVRRLDVSDGRTPTDGMVVFRHHTFTIRPPRPGLVVDPRVAGTAFWSAYLSDDPSVQLRLSPTPPAIDTAAIHRFVRRFANPAMASPVELHLGRADLHLSPADYGDLLAARRAGDRLRPTVHAHALMRLARSDLADARADKPRPATVALVAGRPQVVKARPGVRFRSGDLASALLHAIAAPHRSARVRATPARAAFTNADARRLGIHRQLARYTVRLPRGSRGAQVAADVRRLDGTVLKPGRSLSVRGTLGAATPSGSSGTALATALFNAAWMGGLQVTSHAVATSYSGTAPEGRDASLSAGRDLAFTDNTSYGVLVSAAADPATSTRHGTLTVTLWSTPRWKVTSRDSGRRHLVPAGRHVVRAASCTPRAGRNGFDVTVTRSFAREAHVDHTSSYTVRYAPVAALVCRHPHHHHHHEH